MVYTLKWRLGSCQSRRVRHTCTELHTQLIWVEDAHQDTHMEADKTQTQTRTWARSFSDTSVKWSIPERSGFSCFRAGMSCVFQAMWFQKDRALGIGLFTCPW